MNSRATRLRLMLLTALGTFLASAPVLADDTEIFVNQANTRGVRPNVLLVIDTSASMDAIVSGKTPYDPSQTYTGPCDRSSLYWSKGGQPPDCATSAKVALASNTCNAALQSLNGIGGMWTGRIGQWSSEQLQWQNLNTRDSNPPIECEEDAGIHGSDATSVQRWARNGGNSPWTSTAASQLSWTSIDVHTLYTTNWLNWYHAAPDNSEITRLQAVQAATSMLAHSLSGVNIGLMRFSNNDPNRGDDAAAEGGIVTHAIEDIASARDSIVQQINAFTAGGYTPLSEALYEAGQYLAGRPVDYGLTSRVDAATPFPSVPASRSPADTSRYKSPIEYECQRNYVVLLTDGEPKADTSAESKIAAMHGSPCDGSGEGHCLDDMAESLVTQDLSSLSGPQSAYTYAIGFGKDVSNWGFLQETAHAGQGKVFVADDIVGLTNAMQNILGEILQRSATFTTPTIAIDSLNRTQSRNELYVSLFRPEDSLQWPGNLKKYALDNGRVVDAFGQDAVDLASGFFRPSAQSFWSPSTDGDRIEAGGAVSRLPDPAQRRVFTYITPGGTRNLTSTSNQFDVSNARLTDALLGTTGGDPTRDDVIRWARGVDVLDKDGDGDREEIWRFLGDPLHARPAVVTYGGSATSPDAGDAVVFVPTNDGFLHAVDARSGAELWAFIPQELLGRLADLYRDPVAISRTYGLDGDVRVLQFDANQNGIIETSNGDKVWIYFGMRRGGRFYYAVDVTNRSQPVLLWKLGPSQLPGVGETWSTPTVARVHVDGESQNGEKLVLIMGGGYDDAQENYQYTRDDAGHRIFMVDAASGRLLWYAGGADGAGDPDLSLDRMTHSIPGRVVALDTDGDHFADRMYAADLGGRVWRFDIHNERDRASLVTGGVLASLGAADSASPSAETNRRFYYAPDVALIQRRGADPYYNLAIGSGYRGHPLHTGTQDRFYSIRDKNPFGRLTQADYNSFTPITESDLVDITGNLTSASVDTEARGWKLELRLNGGWVGEKVLAEALTVGGAILFPTYQPLPANAANPCLPTGMNRVYALQVDTGAPAVDFDNDLQINESDAWTRLAQTGIAGSVSLFFETRSGSSGDDDGGSDTPGGDGSNSGVPGADLAGGRTVCTSGVEVLQKCVQPDSVVRTFWQRTAE